MDIPFLGEDGTKMGVGVQVFLSCLAFVFSLMKRFTIFRPSSRDWKSEWDFSRLELEARLERSSVSNGWDGNLLWQPPLRAGSSSVGVPRSVIFVDQDFDPGT